MPRQARKELGTGIHLVMMRGINHQNIFEDVEDYYQFMTTLDKVRVQYDNLGLPCGTSLPIYAYCFMSNHLALLTFVATRQYSSELEELKREREENFRVIRENRETEAKLNEAWSRLEA